MSQAQVMKTMKFHLVHEGRGTPLFHHQKTGGAEKSTQKVGFTQKVGEKSTQKVGVTQKVGGEKTYCNLWKTMPGPYMCFRQKSSHPLNIHETSPTV